MTKKQQQQQLSFEPKKKLRIIVLAHEDLIPPDTLDGLTDKEKLEVKTEFDVISTLKKMGHEVYPIGLYNQLNVIGNALLEHKPHIAFNLLEEFHGRQTYVPYVVGYLELLRQPYTGCKPDGLMLGTRQSANQGFPEVACAAGDQDFHAEGCSFCRSR